MHTLSHTLHVYPMYVRYGTTRDKQTAQRVFPLLPKKDLLIDYPLKDLNTFTLYFFFKILHQFGVYKFGRNVYIWQHAFETFGLENHNVISLTSISKNEWCSQQTIENCEDNVKFNFLITLMVGFLIGLSNIVYFKNFCQLPKFVQCLSKTCQAL